jgi:SAM-dependent methyltransferase
VSLDELWPAPDRRLRWARLMELLAPVPGERILDVGFGRGEALRLIARRLGPRGLAVWAQPNAARVGEHARPLAGSGGAPLPTVAADAVALPFAAASFSRVLCVNVLEAVPDRALVLAEMRRVLRPGGHVLVAHDDYESQVYAAQDRELSRRAVRAYAAAVLPAYAAGDGQMGRHLWGLFRAAGFRDAALHVLPLVNTEYRRPLLGWQHAQFPAETVGGDLTPADLDRWRADLERTSARGAYVYCVNLYVCVGRK